MQPGDIRVQRAPLARLIPAGRAACRPRAAEGVSLAPRGHAGVWGTVFSARSWELQTMGEHGRPHDPLSAPPELRHLTLIQQNNTHRTFRLDAQSHVSEKSIGSLLTSLSVFNLPLDGHRSNTTGIKALNSRKKSDRIANKLLTALVSQAD